MREILFRGKRTDNGEWVSSCNLIQFFDKPAERIFFIPKLKNKCVCTHDENDNIIAIEDTILFKVIPETVGQYTGLTDKNGKKIFEGDIILFEDESPTNYEYHDCTEMRCGEIKFDDGEFYLTNRIAVEMGDLVYDGKLDGEIIGNIHDNPELLESEDTE